jgi:outer membrane protein assembly factor BamB
MRISARLSQRAARVSVHRVGMLAAVLASLGAGSATQAARAEPSWPTYHRDAGRSGFDPEGASPFAPSLAWQSPDLGAPIWGQPLILGSRVYVATVGDDLYALDAATGAIVWNQRVGTPVPFAQLPCGDITPTVGIVGTPVIDASRNEIFAVADTAEGGQVHHELVGYDLTSGAELLRTPVDPPGAEPKALLQRTALNLDDGKVVFGFGGNDGDCGTYRGTVVAAPEAGGSPSYWQVPIAVKSGSGGAVWGPSGPVVDGEGHIFASTGNPNPRGGERATVYDYSDSMVELDTALNLLGHFKPPSWEADSNSDTDLGSAGPELLPGGVLFQAGKNGTGYLIAEAGMGSGAEALYSRQVCGGSGSYGGDAYVAGVIYVACSNGVQALAYNAAPPSFTSLWKGPSDAAGPPIVSAGLVWVIATRASPPGSKLYGLDPATGVPRYTETLPSPAIDHFASPSAAGGRLFVASGSSVTAYSIAVPLPGTLPSSSAVPLPGAVPLEIAAASNSSTSPSAPERRGAAISLVGAGLTVTRSGRLVVKLSCASWTGVCRGTITLRTLAARRGRAGKSVSLLAEGRFKILGGHFETLTLRLGIRARRLLLHTSLLPARVTIAMRDSSGALQVLSSRATLRLARPRRR